MSSSPSNSSLASNDSDVRDASLASDNHLTYYHQQTTLTGRRVLAKNRRRGQGPYMFEETRKGTEMQIATTVSVPDFMIREQRQAPARMRPIDRPPAGGGPADRLQVVRRWIPEQRRDGNGEPSTTRARYATPTPAQGRLRAIRPARRMNYDYEIIVIDDSDDEDPKGKSKDNTPTQGIFTQKPTVEDVRDKDAGVGANGAKGAKAGSSTSNGAL